MLFKKFEENMLKLNETEDMNKQLKKEITDTNKLRERLLLIEKSKNLTFLINLLSKYFKFRHKVGHF